MTTPAAKLVEKFQCPGCMLGSDTKCGSYKPHDPVPGIHSCIAHAIGTTIMRGMGNEKIALGLPEGFNQFQLRDPSRNRTVQIRLHEGKPPVNFFGPLDRAIWATVEDGYLFVRTYSPRTDRGFTDVFPGGTLDDLPPGVPAYEDEIASLHR